MIEVVESWFDWPTNSWKKRKIRLTEEQYRNYIEHIRSVEPVPS